MERHNASSWKKLKASISNLRSKTETSRCGRSALGALPHYPKPKRRFLVQSTTGGRRSASFSTPETRCETDIRLKEFCQCACDDPDYRQNIRNA